MINLKKNDAVAESIKQIMEKELSAKQKRIAALAGDKNSIDALDLAALRAGKKPTSEETVEENAFDYKSPRQPEPNGGSGVKQGSRYGGSKQKEKPEQEEPKEKKEDFSHFKKRLVEKAMLKMAAKKAFKTLTGGSDEDQRKELQRKMGVPQTGQKPTQKEEVELDEAKQESKKDFEDRQKRLAAASAETAKDPKRLERLSKIPGYSAAMDLAKKTTKEEVEQVDEKAPPGFEGTVRAMKKHKDVTNPFALAWSMKNKGYKSHKKADGSDK